MFSEFGFLEKSDVEIGHMNEAVISSFFSEDLSNKMVVFSAFSDQSCADELRKCLYTYHYDEGVEFIDVGNVASHLSGNKKLDAIKVIATIIIKQNCLPIFFSNDDKCNFALYSAFENYEQWVSVCEVSGAIQMFSEEDFLVKMLSHRPNYLFNYAHLAAQGYFVPSTIKETLSTLNFGEIRLGNLRSNAKISEPLLRTADFVILNSNALKFSELNSYGASPNGLYSEDLCQLARYAGMSDQCNGVSFIHPFEEFDNTVASLFAQLFWCFSTSVIRRLGDYPVGDYTKYVRYDVFFDKDDLTLTFYKSNISDRWWLKTPDNINRDHNFKRHALIACSENDYLECSKGVIPKIWWTEMFK
jgi:hypothetical protein